MRAWSYALLGIVPALFIGAVVGMAPIAAATGDGPDKVGERGSLLGSYLAGRLARSKNDVPAAATYYGKALEHDPDSEVLTDFAFQMEASHGNWPRVEALARDIVKRQPTHRLARAFLGLADFKAGRYAEAEEHFKESSGHPVGELTAALARAWIYQAQNRTQEALAALDAPKPRVGHHFLLPSRARRRCGGHRRRPHDLSAFPPTSARFASLWPSLGMLPTAVTRGWRKAFSMATSSGPKGEPHLRARLAG
jgi:hypothetical protein